ncbi:MAG: alpha-galactosidase [Opitutae bacterium]|nr:alpha-galactosidase [Opitutae bacterium]
MQGAEMSVDFAAILTPPAPATPRINGPSVFGVRPGSPLLYTIPATGDRPMVFSVESLPEGLAVDAATGRITGSLATPGNYPVVLRARNARGTAARSFRIVSGEAISLTPAMGWNSWNCWARAVDADKVLRAARAMAATGLSQHGWTYVNIDDTWEGTRSGEARALQPNQKFPDLRALCDEIHALGLKAGIYSTPWITTYAGHAGGSSDNADGAWTPALKGAKTIGKHSFAATDARQWAEWGFDYLKYDWAPNDLPSLAEMSAALRRSGRDIIFSVSNSAPFELVADLARLANSWRTTNDIRDRWAGGDPAWAPGVSEIGFSQGRWAPHAGPGHWNDPDMLVVGHVGWGPQLHPTHLSPDEQYSHLSLWCRLSAPLILGCDLEQLDAFTLNLLTNDEVLALDQDALGRPAVCVATVGAVDVYLKELEDGTKAVGFFNRDAVPQTITFNRPGDLGLKLPQKVRDLWRQQDLPEWTRQAPLQMTGPGHGVMLCKFSPGE